MSFKLVKYIFLFLLCSTKIFGQNISDSLKFDRQFGFQSDNDAYLFYGQDQYYTNGLFISYKQAKFNSNNQKKWIKKVQSFSISQEMFNPRNGYVPKKEDQDRPFAAKLYASYGETKFFKNHSLFKLSFDLGILGPDAKGKETQEFLHNTVGFYEIAGWEYQIENSLLTQINLNYYKDLNPNSKGKLNWGIGTSNKFGTTLNKLNFHVLLRLGIFNSIINSSIYDGDLGATNSKTKNSSQLNILESFFYVSPSYNYVLNDASIQGSFFDNKSPLIFKPIHSVWSTKIGYQINLKRFKFDYHIILNSKEIKSSALPHQYASLSINYKFN